MKNQYTLVVDVGGVLHRSDTGFVDDLRAELRATDEKFDMILQIIFNELGRGIITEDELWLKLEKEFDMRHVRADEHLLTRSLSNSFTPNLGFLQYVKTLRKRGIRLAVFSNTIEPHVDFLRKAGVYDDFTEEFFSNEIGYRKPDKKAFEYVLNALDADPENVVFIDDDSRNIQTASQLGIKTVLFKNEEDAVSQVEKYLAL